MTIEQQVCSRELAEKIKEEWMDVAGYEGLYQISNLGRIKSLSKRGSYREKIMKPWDGEYEHMALTKNNKQKVFRVHRLVAEAFVPNHNGYCVVNHKDGNKKNNCADNLEWVTSRQNQLHAYATGLKSNVGINNPRAKLNDREVTFMRYMKGLHPEITSKEVADFYGMSDVSIQDIFNFKKWKHLAENELINPKEIKL